MKTKLKDRPESHSDAQDMTPVAAEQPGDAPMKQLAPFDSFKESIERLKTTAETLSVKDISDKAGMALARTTRLALREIRIAVEHRRKELGEAHLRAKQAVDADARGIFAMIEPLELRLKDEEQFVEREIARLQQEKREARTAEIAPFLLAPLAVDTGIMGDTEWQATLADAKAGHQARIDREAEALVEAERGKIRAARTLEIAPLRQFLTGTVADLGTMTEDKFAELVTLLQGFKKKDDAEREKQRLDNLRLQKSVDRERQISAFTLAASLERPADLGELTDDAFAALLAGFKGAHTKEANRIKDASDVAEAEAKKERDKAAAALKKAQDDAAALKRAADAKKAEDAQKEADRVAAEKKAAAAPDKAKLAAFAEQLRALPLPAVRDSALATLVSEQRDKFAAWIEKKGEEL